MSMEQEYNENNAYNITKRLAFPRLIGSEGEKKAINIVVDEFEKAGFNKEEIYRESFNTSFYNWKFVRFVFIPLGILLILIALSFYFNLWLTILLNVIFIVSASKVLGFASSSEIKLFKDDSKNLKTENIFTRIKCETAKKKVIFMAHWDSKSQIFPSILRIVFFMVVVFGFLGLTLLFMVLSVIQIFISFSFPLLNYILLGISIFVSSIGFLNFFNKTQNKSPGALDNAASVGTVIELARYYKHRSMDEIDLTFLITGSEELNLAGAKFFIKQHRSEYEHDSSFFINFDTIGGEGVLRIITSYGLPRKTSSKKLNDLFLSAAKRMDIDAKNVYLPTGAWSDYMPIVKQGFEACWLSSSSGLAKIHTKKDDMSLVSEIGLKNVLKLTIKVVKKLMKE
ncbi:MAG: M28 family peptidase [Candidatus Lokiarchaeota archaeon]|nr:M28 family peptidase [Candidatus Lokiarchaeota archaeon]MBD3342180.1 M28 family peptidase [Candidatus Lokiarchaeota archaeon]